MLQQLKYFGQDILRMLGRKKLRILYIGFSRSFWGIGVYRLERILFSLFGKAYPYIRIIFIPIFNLIQAYSNLDIHYQANVRGGLCVLHPSVGVVISGFSIVGSNLTLTGGNMIGSTGKARIGDIVIGDNCELGANAVIIGPIILGNRIRVGASACVIHNFNRDDVVLVGVPAKPINVG